MHYVQSTKLVMNESVFKIGLVNHNQLLCFWPNYVSCYTNYKNLCFILLCVCVCMRVHTCMHTCVHMCVWYTHTQLASGFFLVCFVFQDRMFVYPGLSCNSLHRTGWLPAQRSAWHCLLGAGTIYVCHFTCLVSAFQEETKWSIC